MKEAEHISVKIFDAKGPLARVLVDRILYVRRDHLDRRRFGGRTQRFAKNILSSL